MGRRGVEKSPQVSKSYQNLIEYLFQVAAQIGFSTHRYHCQEHQLKGAQNMLIECFEVFQIRRLRQEDEL
jgi:hypothetical protein